jgi:integrase
VLYGLRRSELLGLRWSTVNLKAGTLRIEQALVEVHSRRRVPRLRVTAGGVLIAGPLALRFRLLARFDAGRSRITRNSRDRSPERTFCSVRGLSPAA